MYTYMHAFSIIECISGYGAVNCSSPCPYPYYGVGCQRTCNCSRNLCDVSMGCIDGIVGNHILIFFSMKKKRERKCINLVPILILRMMVSFKKKEFIIK